jgi:hypothetical protein
VVSAVSRPRPEAAVPSTNGSQRSALLGVDPLLAAAVPGHHGKLGNFVWGIADQLRGVYKPHQYGGLILPFTILRRLDCVVAQIS